jgi:hypothetical protein
MLHLVIDHCQPLAVVGWERALSNRFFGDPSTTHESGFTNGLHFPFFIQAPYLFTKPIHAYQKWLTFWVGFRETQENVLYP